MKKILFYTFICIILPALIFSCDEKNGIGIPEDNGNDTLETKPEPIKDYWDANNFQPLNDEFNDFRAFQAGLMYPYDFSNSRVQGFFKNPNIVDVKEIGLRERLGKGFLWIEVTYPKNNPSKMKFSVYKTSSRHVNHQYLWQDLHMEDVVSDTTVLRTTYLYKDSVQIAIIEQLPHGRFIINRDNERKLLYDFHRVALASNGIMLDNDTANTQTVYSFQNLKDELIDSDKCLDEHYFAQGPYGDKVLGTFGSLSGFLTPISGPCPKDSVREVVGLREGSVILIFDGGPPIIGADRFIYKNAQSPAAPYLPETIWDIKDTDLWNRY